MMHDFGLSETQLGLILGAFAWSYGLFQMPGGMLGERFGPRRAMTLIFVGWLATTALMALVPRGLLVVTSVALLFTLRAAQGIVQAPVFPISCGSFFAWLPSKHWAFGNSVSTAGTTVGAALAGPGVTWLVLAVGWRESFVIAAPLGLVLAAIWWWDYRDNPAAHRRVNAGELDIIRDGQAPEVHVEPMKWTRLLADRDLLFVTSSYFCANYVFICSSIGSSIT